MKLQIVEYPDKRLREKSKEVEVFDEKLHKLLDVMYPFMIETNGIGLAAVQVEYPVRALLLNIPDEEGEQHPEDLLEIINPKIIEADGETVYQEGCLSVPQFYEDVKRHDRVTLEYQNRHGEKQTLEAEGLLAIAIQHEIDHLEGVLFIDRLSYSRRKKFEKEYKKILKERKKKR
jgi:peptide deformylase